MKNLADKINEVLFDCFFKPEELVDGTKMPSNGIMVEGVVNNFGFNPERIEKNKEKIRSFLNMMPSEFHKNSGGGWSFLNLCMDANGNQWGEHSNMEALVALGIASNMAKYVLPKELWSALPGGVPYVVFDTEVKANE